MCELICACFEKTDAVLLVSSSIVAEAALSYLSSQSFLLVGVQKQGNALKLCLFVSVYMHVSEGS